MNFKALWGSVLVMFGGAAVSAQLTTTGSLDISPSGAAVYTVPIAIPPGVAGLQPSLSLVYSSQGGGSQVGGGFSLSGLSAITRCPPSPAQDNARRPLAFDLTDRYCLDGQRLMLVGGTEGADGAEYRTEMESFSRIKAYNPAGSNVTGGPAYFVVQTKSGLTMEFGALKVPDGSAQGADSGARVFAKNVSGSTETVVATWALSKVSDTVGNYMTFRYNNDTASGTYYLTQIDYTGNANKTNNPATTSRVSFSYAPTEGVARYQTGRMITSAAQLTEVQTSQYMPASGSYGAGYYTVNKYTLGSDGRTDATQSRYATVTECGYAAYAASSLCKPPIKIAWDGPGKGFTAVNFATSSPWGSADNTWVGDFNGDGLSDIATASGANVYIRLSTGVQGNSAFSETNWTIPNGAIWGAAGYSWVGDFNGDGRSDIATTSGGNIYVLISTGSGFTAQTWATGTTWGSKDLSWIGDFDGDGRADLASAVGSTVYMHLSTGSTFANSSWSVPTTALASGICSGGKGWAGDFNGDGRSDLALEATACGDARYVVLDSTGAAWGVAWASARVNDFTVLGAGDVNGDGLADLVGNQMSLTSGNWTYSYQWRPAAVLSRGQGLEPVAVPSFAASTWRLADIALARIGDFNGDGLADMLLFSQDHNTAYLALSKGNGFSEDTWDVTGTWPDARYVLIGDFDGDGRTDLAGTGTATLGLRVSAAFAEQRNVTFTNGMPGGDATVSHVTLPVAKRLGYYTTAAVSYPKMPMLPPMSVARTLKTQDGVARPAGTAAWGTRSTTYQYAGYTSEAASGRGMPFFQQIQVTDPLGFTNTSVYRMDFPYMGLLATSTQTKNGVTMGVTTNSYACIHPDPTLAASAQPACTVAAVSGKRYHVYPQATVTNQVKDLDGTALPGSRTLTELVDGYGNVGRITTVTLNPDGSDSVYKKVIDSTYYNNTASGKWLLGRLLKTTVATTGPDTPASVTPGQGNLAAAPAPALPAQVLMPILSLLLDD